MHFSIKFYYTEFARELVANRTTARAPMATMLIHFIVIPKRTQNNGDELENLVSTDFTAFND